MLALVVWSAPAHAARLGPPWMALVSAEQTTLYSSPEQADPVGPLAHGAMVVVIGQQSDWAQTPDGWLPSSDVQEAIQPWIGEVSDPSVLLYARPNTNEAVLREADQGDLVRVTGVSPGIDGDTSLWWATTDGYVNVHSISSTANPFAEQWMLPSAEDAMHGWWGQVDAAHVRAAPTTDAPVVGEFAGGERVKVLAEEEGPEVNGSNVWYRIDGGRFAGGHVHSWFVQRIADPQPTLAPPAGDVGHDPWIVVDRASSTLTLLRDGQPRFTTYVSLGQAGRDTAEGAYNTYIKYRADRMASATVPDADHSYDLPNVPFTQYFKDDGSAIHGTYWHDAFGTNQSQGCINLTWSDAAFLFDQTQPLIPAEQIGFPVDPAEATQVVIVN